MSLSLLQPDVYPPGVLLPSTVFNNNVRRLVAQTGPVISASTTAQPGSPSDRDAYIIPAEATGATWATYTEGDIAIYYDGTWTAYAPYEGLRKFVMDEGSDGEDWQYLAVSDGGWGPAGSGAAVSSVNGDTGAVTVLIPIGIACSDETTALTTGLAKATFRLPFAMTLLSGAAGVRASLTTAQTGSGGGGVITVDINESGSTILSTKLTIDNTEKTSTTAATPAVISNTSLADDAEITIDIDQIGDGTAKGLKIWLIGYPS